MELCRGLGGGGTGADHQLGELLADGVGERVGSFSPSVPGPSRVEYVTFIN